jgi:hypothetical protein
MRALVYYSPKGSIRAGCPFWGWEQVQQEPCATSGLIIKTRIIPELTLTLVVTRPVIHGIICVHDPVNAERMPGFEQSGKFLLGQIVEDTVSLFLVYHVI